MDQTPRQQLRNGEDRVISITGRSCDIMTQKEDHHVTAHDGAEREMAPTQPARPRRDKLASCVSLHWEGGGGQKAGFADHENNLIPGVQILSSFAGHEAKSAVNARSIETKHGSVSLQCSWATRWSSIVQLNSSSIKRGRQLQETLPAYT